MNVYLFLMAWPFFTQPVLPVGGDPVPYFKRDPVHYGCEPPHWKATECAQSDKSCQQAHEDRVMDVAVMAGDIQLCRAATYPGPCVDVVNLVVGNLPRASR